MAIYALSTAHLMLLTWKRDPITKAVLVPYQMYAEDRVPPQVTLNKEDTYILIFGKQQYKAGMEYLKKKGYKILYESQPADNSQHPGSSANTVVVFEVK